MHFRIYLLYERLKIISVMEGLTTPKSTRTGWFLEVTSVEGVADLGLIYKNARRELAPYSAAKQNAHVKLPWGTPVKCEYISSKNGDELSGQFKFSNKRRETATFNLSQLNSFDGGVNAFSKRITAIVTQKRECLLAIYLSLLPHMRGFAQHREGVHSECGFLLDESGVKEDDVVKQGGSMDELKAFVKAAQESAKVVNPSVPQVGSIKRFLETRKRNSQDSVTKPAKKSNIATMDENESKELTDEDGLEKEYQNSFVGFATIPLENLRISPHLEVKVNKL